LRIIYAMRGFDATDCPLDARQPVEERPDHLEIVDLDHHKS